VAQAPLILTEGPSPGRKRGITDVSPAFSIGWTRTRDTFVWGILYNPTLQMAWTPQIPSPQLTSVSESHHTMISIASFITLAVAGMVVAFPLERATAVSLSRRQSDSDRLHSKFVTDA
jgi:hypothetical protein